MSIRVKIRYSNVVALAALALALPDCSSAGRSGAEQVGSASQKVLGLTTYDSSCHAADVPHIDRAMRYARAAINSAAFTTCLSDSFNMATTGGQLVGPGLNIGPYMACSTDPPNTTPSVIEADLLSANPTLVACDYAELDSSTGGQAGVGGVDATNSATPERITLGSALADFQNKTVPCFQAPNDPNCVPNISYTRLADTMMHEIMHQHGYNHMEFESPTNFLCGIPASQNPQYQNGIPYMVGECIYAALAASDTYCSDMYTGCGEGLDLVQTTFTSTATCSCVAPAAVRHPGLRDINGDGAPDLLWHNASTGESQAWFMNGTLRTGFNSIKEQSTQQVLDVVNPWNPVGLGDINGDNNADILWQNSQTGEIQVWFLGGTDRIGFNSIHEQSTGALLQVPSSWYLGATGDINGDLQVDLVFHSPTTGQTQAWFLSGTNRTGFNYIKDHATQSILTVTGTDWTLVSAADFDLDGNVDLVWHNVTTGDTQIWFMLGTDRTGFADVKDSAGASLNVVAPWSLTGTADVNRDGSPDLIWHNSSTGETQIWYMSSTNRIGFSSVSDSSAPQTLLDVTSPWNLVAE